MKQQTATLLRKVGAAANGAANRLYRADVDRELDRWYRLDGEHTHRLRYDLDEHSVVIDVGGYQGQWASDIFAMYRPSIHVFEPVREFAEGLRQRFRHNSRVRVHAVGLAGANGPGTMYLDDNGSSLYLDAGRGTETVSLVKASEWLCGQSIRAIDLMKIHTEGAEYDLLEHLIEAGWMPRIRDVQVQFHDYAPRAHERLATIRERLGQTHDLTYQFPWVWENWRRRRASVFPA
jgi:FkbM family methyltransferase